MTTAAAVNDVLELRFACGKGIVAVMAERDGAVVPRDSFQVMPLGSE